MNRKNIVVLTGAGISAESGISTFRDAGGLWEGHDIMEVASPQGWAQNRKLVLEFYNLRRKQLATVSANAAHTALVKLEEKFNVHIITQNVDDLHERAGSKNVLHLHGELVKARSSADPSLVYNIEYTAIEVGATCEKGSQLRPHIVWFGEAVPMYEYAEKITSKADILLVIGTSLVVYPAAGLTQVVKSGTPIYMIDPNIPEHITGKNITKIALKATKGVPEIVTQLLKNG